MFSTYKIFDHFFSIFKKEPSAAIKIDQIEYQKASPEFGEWHRVRNSGSPVRYAQNGEGVWEYLTPTKENTARIMCAGDMMCEPTMSRAVFHNDKFFFEPCFSRVKNVFEAADFAIANLETQVDPNYPYAIDKHKLEDRYHCNAPVEYLDAVRYAGIDAVTMANNHSGDVGAAGLVNTINNVEQYGLMHTGAFKPPEEKRYLIVEINGIKVAFFSYTEHINSRLDEKCFTEEGRKVMLNLFSKDKLEKDLKDAKQDGAEFTLVYIHFWCKDYTHEVQDSQIACVNIIAESGADCIVGGHPHSVMKYDEIITSSGKRVPVTYCLGNFITSDSNMITRTNYIYELFLKKDADGQVTIADEMVIPCRIIETFNKSSYIVFPTPKNWRDGNDYEILQDAEKEIMKNIGDKISIDDNTCMLSSRRQDYL